MLVVLSIVGVLMGISVAAFRRSIPHREIARRAVFDALVQARLFSVAENAPATVSLEPGDEETRWASVTALGRKTVGNWHLEGTDLSGWPVDARAAGEEEAPAGKVGKALRLSDTKKSWLEVPITGAFDARDGFAFEFFVKLDQRRNQLLFSKGKSIALRCENGGALGLQVQVEGRDAASGEAKTGYQSLATPPGVVRTGRFVKIAASFDGLQLRLAVDDAVAAELALPQRAPFLPDWGASLMIGSVEESAGFEVDELKWGIFAGTTQELRDVELGPGPRMVRFGPDGALDPRFHQVPAEICLLTAGGEPDAKKIQTWLRVGLLGDVR